MAAVAAFIVVQVTWLVRAILIILRMMKVLRNPYLCINNHLHGDCVQEMGTNNLHQITIALTSDLDLCNKT